MNNITISNRSIERKIYNNQPVVTFKDIDLVHQRVEGTARRNFYQNQKHFIENEDYFEISRKDYCTKFVHLSRMGNPQSKIQLFTESGYLMLVKSFTDDLAWEVQRQLVKSYFRLKEVKHNQKELTNNKLQHKTYKNKPVMIVNDLCYITSDTRDAINWKIRSKSLGTLLTSRTLDDFKNENKSNFNVYTKMNILFYDDVLEILKAYKIDKDKMNMVEKYFYQVPAKAEKVKMNDIKLIQKLDKLSDLIFLIQRFSLDEKMMEDITEIISERYVELSFLDKSHRNLDINTKDGWNLLAKLLNYKHMIARNIR